MNTIDKDRTAYVAEMFRDGLCFYLLSVRLFAIGDTEQIIRRNMVKTREFNYDAIIKVDTER